MGYQDNYHPNYEEIQIFEAMKKYHFSKEWLVKKIKKAVNSAFREQNFYPTEIPTTCIFIRYNQNKPEIEIRTSEMKFTKGQFRDEICNICNLVGECVHQIMLDYELGFQYTY
ncbi:hypothetical protein TVAG_183470 [Trichomonas vaginalis G3]|uniref:Uncharacterized protein n=1 Tax=Trichomonas vaginalis (strain ATCC PRA-98 / G3) TaxID=412133 RepID=A2D985_TRIV3|nr:hypothetical protein TVAGG3_0771080 [Trichomonas vaginalis G3]EAY23111.1 hypothetical protein TVAG_183470 [Trichomonas vaginalis G3]KAI5513831.1 hypothetical protein TVAGG3_0771080 [Trichomonas vaginalis G3]|eukprot:XP_001584097.1 hypothetical protein [Trichomonas vaginalis G3]